MGNGRKIPWVTSGERLKELTDKEVEIVRNFE